METNLKYVSIYRVGIEDMELFVKYRIDYITEIEFANLFETKS